MSTALQTSLTLVLALPAQAQPAPNARPTGGVVIAGSASIGQTTGNTAINQSSQRAAVNWQSFNLGSQQSVTFNQPSASAVTLNRVVGPDPSQIAGRIDANGQVVLTNQSGVTFYKGAQVNTNGLMVSAIGMTSKAVQGFMASGQVVLDQPGNPNAAVINNGNITVKQAGLAALVAPQVANHGTITAELGHVVLAGAKTATLDLYGDGLLSLDVTNQVTQAPVGKDGKPVAALVTNSGVIIADGGTVQLTARAADGIVQTLVDAGGTIRTATTGGHTGTIALNGMGGSIIVEGQLSAVGTTPGTTGGAIEVASDGNVGIASTARINASGKAGGGTVAIGTTLARARGGPGVASTLTAKNATVAKGATIKANATDNGNGGRITVLSGGATQIDGQISATGGANGGNGGFVETSGNTLGVGTTASIDVAGRGRGAQAGTWLLDPFDIDITATDSNTSETNGSFTASDENATIANTTLQTALGNGNVIISTAGNGTADQGNILVASPVTWTSGSSLTLAADNNILINAPISASNGGLVLNAGTTTPTGSITISAPVAAQNFAATAGTAGAINLNFGTTPVVTTGGGGQTYNSPVVLPTDASVTDTGNAPIDFVSTIDAATANGQSLTVNAGSGTVTFRGALGSAEPLNSISATGGSIMLGGNITSSALTLDSTQAGVALSIATTINTGPLSLNSAGAITEAGAITATSLTGGATGTVGLTSSNNAITNLGNFAVSGTGNFALVDSSPMTVTGNASVTGATAQLFLQAPGISVAAPTGALNADTNTGLVSLETNNYANSGAIKAATVELAPIATTQTVTLGTTGSGLSLPSLTNITAPNVIIGAVTQPGGSPVTTAAGISIGGPFGNGPVNLALDATGAVSEGTGIALTAKSLSGAGASISLLNAANAIASIGSLSATNGNLFLADGSPLVIASKLGATGNVFLKSTSVTVDAGAAVTAGAASLASVQADTFLNNGTVSSNTFEIAPLTTNGVFTLNPGFAAGIGATKVRIGAVTIPDVGLTTTAGSIVIASNFGAITTALELESHGGISEAGTSALTASSLTGSAGGDVSLNNNNAIATLAGFNDSGFNFSLIDTGPLGVSNTVSGASVTLSDNNELTINGTATATAVSLTANTISIPGLVNGNLVGLFGGSVNEGGTLIATTLTGNLSGASTLTGATTTINQVQTIANLAANGFTLDDGVAVTASGALAGGSAVTIRDSGDVTIGAAASVTGNAIRLTGADVTIAGTSSDGGGAGTTSLVATSGTVSVSGALTSGTLTGSAETSASLPGATATANQITTLAGFDAPGGFTLNDGTALTVADTLSGGPNATILDKGALEISGSVKAAAVSLTADSIAIPGLTNGGSVSLAGTVGAISETGTIIAGTLTGRAATTATLAGASAAANQIGIVNSFTAPQGFTLDDGASLTVAGTISGGPGVSILDQGALAINGAVAANTIVLTANAIGIAGNVSGNAVTLTSDTGAISETGVLNALSLTGSAATSANFAGTNQISTLNGFSAPGGFSLSDGIALSVLGTVSGGPGVTIADTSSLGISGNVSASAVSLSAASITIPGNVAADTASLVSNNGTITETGAMNVGTLTGSSTGTATFTGNNAIASLSNFTANGLTLIDNSSLGVIGAVQAGPHANIMTGGSLTIAGALVANAIALQANSGILIPGEVAAANSASLVTNTGSILETGMLIANLLTASAPGDITLSGNGGNQVAELGNITSGGTLTLNDSINLLISGPLSAPKIVINAPASNVTLADGATIATGGTSRPPGTVTDYPSAQTASAGTFITAANFFQLGNSTVVGLGNAGNPNIIRITVPDSGNITFSQTGGLTGNASWVILELGTGQATGGIFLRSLDVIRSGTSGGTNLFGTINGVTGAAAAGAGNIAPTESGSFRFNACPIHSITCVLLSGLGLPVANPLNEIYVGSIYNPNDQDDLLLPIVSDQDY